MPKIHCSVASWEGMNVPSSGCSVPDFSMPDTYTVPLPSGSQVGSSERSCVSPRSQGCQKFLYCHPFHELWCDEHTGRCRGRHKTHLCSRNLTRWRVGKGKPSSVSQLMRSLVSLRYGTSLNWITCAFLVSPVWPKVTLDISPTRPQPALSHRSF
jgi:hypothetical protein